MKKKNVGVWVLAGSVAVVAAVATVPTFGGSKQVAPRGPLNASGLKLKAQRAVYEKSVGNANADFFAKQYDKALDGYRAAKALPTLSPDPTIDCKMGTCFAALGRYRDALAAFRAAQTTDQVGSSTGLIDAEIALLAFRHGDAATLHDVVSKSHGRYLEGGKIRDDVTLTSGPGESSVSDAQVFLVFARAFAAAYQREGVDFAYGKAMAMSHSDPRVAMEYAFSLRANFYDVQGEADVLSQAGATKDPHLTLDIKRELQSARQTLSISVDKAPSKVEALKRGAFQAQGVY
ncbi:hypothetical protein [Fimbriimonas ginsengisoli]|uniref:hypothetical protein n=1 Tax=Fimbriimonas ginsengisoli TaxID=1005039 RepID=UPI0011866DAC|nr:hypothetical protein [Fimbriimonas ginsengisoli]